MPHITEPAQTTLRQRDLRWDAVWFVAIFESAQAAYVKGIQAITGRQVHVSEIYSNREETRAWYSFIAVFREMQQHFKSLFMAAAALPYHKNFGKCLCLNGAIRRDDRAEVWE